MDDDYERMRWNYRRAFIKSAAFQHLLPMKMPVGDMMKGLVW
jgi:hypothetical protein